MIWLARVQAAYFVVTGLWPIVHIRSFTLVTGPKYDLWLVKTVGVLITVIGLTIGMAGWRRRVVPEVFVLAVGSAAALGFVDVYYHLRGTIPAVYLLDAAAEAVLVVVWLVAWNSTRRKVYG
jgi:hypothetical protein